MFVSTLGIDFVLMISLPVEQNVYSRVRQVGEKYSLGVRTAPQHNRCCKPTVAQALRCISRLCVTLPAPEATPLHSGRSFLFYLKQFN